MSTAKSGSAVLGTMALGHTETPPSLFIVDRTQEHVKLLKRLRAKGWSNLTADERKQWSNEAAKGAYNYTDLNRVETAVSQLSDDLGIKLTTKTNWTVWDVPTKADMNRYLSNVIAIENACPWEMNFPTLPNSLDGMTYETANDIETILMLVHNKTQTARSGEIYCGEV